MGKKIVVVDDDEGIVEVVQIVLEGEGYLVQTCMNSDALSYALGALPDLILLDVLLAGEDGREICKNLKRDEATKHIPVIMLSAHSDGSEIASMSGADNYLEKPFDVDDLIDIVKKYLVTDELVA